MAFGTACACRPRPRARRIRGAYPAPWRCRPRARRATPGARQGCRRGEDRAWFSTRGLTQPGIDYGSHSASHRTRSWRPSLSTIWTEAGHEEAIAKDTGFRQWRELCGQRG